MKRRRRRSLTQHQLSHQQNCNASSILVFPLDFIQVPVSVANLTTQYKIKSNT